MSKRVFFFPGKAILLFSALYLTLAAVSCSSKYEISLESSGSAAVRFQAQADEGVLRDIISKAAIFSGADALDAKAPVFDQSAIKEGFASRTDLALEEFAMTGAATAKGRARIPSISNLGNADGKGAPFFSLLRSKGTASLSFRLDRRNANRLPDLVPGLNRSILDMLAPPAVFGDDISTEDYSQNLQPFIGKKGMAALTASSVEIRVSPPGKILSQTGGKIENGEFVTQLPLMTALVLEKPFEFSLNWKE